ncbi:DUF3794 domain-containing protein [Halocella sp. SP3-1]|nr:DUF3794 domain-containing protein [Halocella sp. SP3-1]
MKGGIIMKKIRKTLKLLELTAEEPVHVFETTVTEVSPAVVELLDPVLSVEFDRVVLFQNRAIVQGTIFKNLIYKAVGGQLQYVNEEIPFSKEVELPGVSPNFTTGRFNKMILTNNVIEIGPGNRGAQTGIDIQLYVTQLTAAQIILDTTTVEQKIILDFIIKVSEYTQQDVDLPAPGPVFECRNIIKCNNLDC